MRDLRFFESGSQLPPDEFDNSRTDDDLSEEWAALFDADHLAYDEPTMGGFMVNGDECVWINAYDSDVDGLRMIVLAYPACPALGLGSMVKVLPVGPQHQIGDAFGSAYLQMERVGWKSASPRSVGR